MIIRTLSLRLLGIALLLPAGISPALALVSNMLAGPPQIYLQVGDGNYSPANGPGVNATVNTVRVNVPGRVLGDGSPQIMNSDSQTRSSLRDGFPICEDSTQVYIGAWWRDPGTATSSATLSISAPQFLISENSDRIPFSKIRWDSTAFGDNTAHIAAGNFGALHSTAIVLNTWVENCHIFFYANDVLVPTGTYKGTVTYTLSTP